MNNLYIFNHILEDKAISALLRFKESHNETDYYIAARSFISFAEHRYTDGDIIKEYILRAMLEYESLPDITKLRNFLRHDVKVIFSEILNFDWNGLFIQCGLLPMNYIEVPGVECDIPGYTSSVKTMLDCSSNEALGGAILAHTESFNTSIRRFI